MTEARVPRLSADDAKAAAIEAGLPEFMAELSIFQVLLRHPRVARAVNDLLVSMLWKGALDSRLRELLIMRIGWLTASDYEWTQHWRIAAGVGISADDLLGVRDWRGHDSFDARERAVLAATDEVVRDGAISADTWATCRTRTRPRPHCADRARHRDRDVADDLVAAKQPPGAVGGRRRELAARRQASASDDAVGLDGMGDDVAVGVGGGDLGEGELPAAPHGATVAQQVRALGRAGVLDAH